MGHHWLVTLWGMDVHMNTLIMVWAAIAVLLVLAWWLTSDLQIIPSRKQSFAESIYDTCRSITYSTAGERGDTFLYYIGALFLFILTANLMGQLPLRLIELPHGELIAATGDINVPAALAICTLVMYFYVGIKTKGLKYFKHYLSPLPIMIKDQPAIGKFLFIFFFWPLMLMNFLEDVTRPTTLTIRLYFNIFVGEVLAMVAAKLVPIGLGAGVIFLELFVAFIQAYIFAILSSVYISLLSEDHDHPEHDEHHSAGEPPSVSSQEAVAVAA